MRTKLAFVVCLALAACSEAEKTADAPTEPVAEAAPTIEPIEIGQYLTLQSEVIGEERQVLIHTPASYEFGDLRYPVLYLTDPSDQFDHTVATMRFLSRQGRMPELIIVGIANTDRTRDLTPPHANPANDGIWDPENFPTGGGADNLIRFIETELIPYVEAGYRTENYRVFAGHSFGGLFAVHMLTSNPDLFDAVIAISPSLWWDDGAPLTRAEEFFASRESFDKSFYFALGTEGPMMQEGFDGLEAVLSAREIDGLDWCHMQLPAEDHGSVVLRSHYAAFEHVFDGWAPAEVTLTAGLGEVEAHYVALSNKFGFTIKVPRTVIYNMGFALLGDEEEGRDEKIFEIMNYNLVNYADVPQVYFVTGLLYERTDNLSAALEMHRRAIEVAARIGDNDIAGYEAAVARVTEALEAPPEDSLGGGE